MKPKFRARFLFEVWINFAADLSFLQDWSGGRHTCIAGSFQSSKDCYGILLILVYWDQMYTNNALEGIEPNLDKSDPNPDIDTRLQLTFPGLSI